MGLKSRLQEIQAAIVTSQILSILCLASALPGSEPVLDRPVPSRLTGAQFAKALEIQISASWENVELRRILNRLASEHKTAVLLDRSINPNREMVLDLGYQRLGAGFHKVAKAASAELSILGNTIYIGPSDRVAKLRTIEHLRKSELVSNKDRLPQGRLRALSRGRTVHWNDLDQPRRIVLNLAKLAGIEVVNPEAIPHDLWAAATLPDASFTEALSLILIQFDLTFAWSADTSQIRLVPIPEKVAVDKAHTPAGGPNRRASRAARERFLKNAAKIWEQRYPNLDTRVDVENNRVIVSGTLEQHEAISGKADAKDKTKSPADNLPPLKRRAFTLQIERVRVIDLMKKLEESGVKFNYDKTQLAARRIDLTTAVSMDVKKADADEFFRKMFDPLNVKFTYKNSTVTLAPKSTQQLPSRGP